MSSSTEPHNTTLHQKLADAVTSETRTQQQHENVTNAVEKDIHQDHHRTTKQAVHDREVLPETHERRVHDTEHRTIDHRDNEGLKDTINKERGQFRSDTVTAPTQHTASQAADSVTERVHHHVHETIQPVVYKETVQPHTVHTTKPVHETHHMKATHERGEELPALSMDEFNHKAQGGIGRDESKVGEAEGCPAEVNTGGVGAGHKHGVGSKERTTGAGSGMGTDGSMRHTGAQETSAAAGGPHKSSLMNKLDPRVDSNGDGQTGFMK